MKRIFSDLLILISVFIFPPYLSALLTVVFIFIFPVFFESIIWAFIIDILYGGGLFWGHEFHYVFTFFVIIIFALSFKLKKQIKFY